MLSDTFLFWNVFIKNLLELELCYRKFFKKNVIDNFSSKKSYFQHVFLRERLLSKTLGFRISVIDHFSLSYRINFSIKKLLLKTFLKLEGCYRKLFHLYSCYR